jgi:hypothetical protein
MSNCNGRLDAKFFRVFGQQFNKIGGGSPPRFRVTPP